MNAKVSSLRMPVGSLCIRPLWVARSYGVGSPVSFQLDLG